MSVSPRMAGIVSERPRPKVLDYTEILERDLEIEMEQNGQFRLRIKALREKLATAQLRIQEGETELKRLRGGRRNMTELAAAIKPALPAQRSMAVGRLGLNIAMRSLSLDGLTIALTHNETGMLAYLAGRPDTIQDARAIARAIGSSPNGQAVRVFMSRLRPKLQTIGAEDYLQSRSQAGGGYWLTTSQEAIR